MIFARAQTTLRGKPAIDTIVVRGFEASSETPPAQPHNIQNHRSDTFANVSDVDAINQISGVKAYVRVGNDRRAIDLNLNDPDSSGLKSLNRHGQRTAHPAQQSPAGQSSIADSVIPPDLRLVQPNTTSIRSTRPGAVDSDADGWAMGSMESVPRTANV